MRKGGKTMKRCIAFLLALMLVWPAALAEDAPLYEVNSGLEITAYNGPVAASPCPP